MKSNVKIKIKIVMILLFTLAPSILVSNNSKYNAGDYVNFNSINEKVKASALSEKIHIDNNWTDAWTAGICTGNGTYSEPYIIEDLEIDAGGSGSCIIIENSNVYFRIENCTLYNTGIVSDAGIKLLYVNNSQIINNTIDANDYGIHLEYSDNNTIAGNKVTNFRGIRLEYSSNNILYLNSLITSSVNIFFMYSYNTYNSQKKFTYTYEGTNYTSYLGNYWSNYEQAGDIDDDGIADQPYAIYPHTTDNYLIDYYPLIEPLENYEIYEAVEETPGIPGYNLFIFTGLISITLIIILKKRKRS
ncbi:MAG: NosD domain-containing protein [Candidatus Hodarchaeota archaeon]